MNVLVLFTVLLIATVLIVYPQLRWAYANYPESRLWLLIRFGSAFLGGAIIGAFLFYQGYHDSKLAIAVMLCGLAFGILFTFLSKGKLQELIAKQDVTDDHGIQ